MKKIFTFQPMALLAVVFCSTVFLGCVSQQAQHSAQTIDENRIKSIEWSSLKQKDHNKDLIAIAGFENRSTYSADKLWDTSSQLLMASLLRSKFFRVVEWERMKNLFDWDTLSSADLIKTPENLKKAQRILLCEYFISGAITYFDVSEHAEVSAITKNKTIETTIRVDLVLQNSRTGEYISIGTGEATEKQVYNGGLTGGQTGSWNSGSADRVIGTAIEYALFDLIKSFTTF